MGDFAAEDLKERVRDATDIVELIGSYLPLELRGRYHLGLCPFHNDSRPSLQVNAERRTYKCWACNSGGDVFSFVMAREAISFREALELLAARAGIELRRQHNRGPDQGSTRQEQYALLSWVADQFHEHLLTSPAAEVARDYLKERRIEADAIGKFRLGYSPPDWTWLRDRANKAGYSDAMVDEAGLLSRSERSSRPFDRFRDRLIFPIWDVQGRVIAFGGRLLPGATANTGKYINSPETHLFRKSRLLYGVHLARESAVEASQIIVMEGYTDVIMAWQSGVTNVVAVMGTALTSEHLQLLNRYVKRTVLVLDGDEAGRKRASDVVALFMMSPLEVQVATLPDGLDPCDFLASRGSGGFQQLIQEAPDALTHRLQLLTANIDLTRDIHAASAALDQLLQLVARMPSASRSTDSLFVLRMRKAMGVIARTFRVESFDVERRLQALRRQRNETTTEVITPDAECDQWDFELLALISYYPAMLPQVRDAISGQQLTSAAGRALYDLWLQTADRNLDRVISFSDVLLATDELEWKRLLVQIDEYSQKHASARDDAPTVLNDLVQAYDRRLNELDTRNEIAELGVNRLSEEEQIDALVRMVERQRNR